MEAVGLKPPGEGKAILAKYNLNINDRASGNPNAAWKNGPA